MNNEKLHQSNNHSVHQNKKKGNIETRFANRMQSIFSAAGQIVNDFYLEIGIYCIGLLNAALVAWSIYTDLVAGDQPLLYAIALGIIALIAVEGLAVYLVGAAAKTNNSWLWFFSVIFAGFFTFAHSYGSENISHYITWAIPFFVVIGYWARTIKVEIETGQADKAQLEREEIERKRKIEDEDRQFQRQLAVANLTSQEKVKIAEIEASQKGQSDSQFGLKSQELRSKLATANQSRQATIDRRRGQLKGLKISNPDLTQKELASELGVSLSTVKNDLKRLNGAITK